MVSTLLIAGTALSYVIKSPVLTAVHHAVVVPTLLSATICAGYCGVTGGMTSPGKDGKDIEYGRLGCALFGCAVGAIIPLLAADLAVDIMGAYVSARWFPRAATSVRFYYYRSAKNQLCGWNGQRWVQMEYNGGKTHPFAKYGYQKGPLTLVDKKIVTKMEAM